MLACYYNQKYHMETVICQSHQCVSLSDSCLDTMASVGQITGQCDLKLYWLECV